MNYDSTPIDAEASTSAPNTSNPSIIDNGTTTNGAPINTAAAAADVPAEAPVVADTPAQERAKLRTRKRSDFLGDLMSKLDMTIYMELCILYYMDCSLFRLLIRLVPQWLFLTPKPPPVPQHKPYIGGIFFPFIVCVLLHIFTARSEAGEAMRFYLHGGIIPDFIGQKSPSSKIVLVLLDTFVLVLQCVMLTVLVEKERLKGVMKSYSAPAGVVAVPGAEQPRAEVATAQDHDAEERGVIRDDLTQIQNGDIELQPLNPTPPSNIDPELASERERLLAEPIPRPGSEDEDENEHAADIFYSGTVVLAEFHVLHNIRMQWANYGNATESAIQTVGFSAGFAAVTANRRLGARFQSGVQALHGD